MEKKDMKYWGMIAKFLRRGLQADKISKHKRSVKEKIKAVREWRAKNKAARKSRRVNHILARKR